MGAITVEVDADEIIDQISDKRILKEYLSRGIDKKNDPSAREVVIRAVSLIKVGCAEDGVTLLEREFLPQWKDAADCQAAYQLAMALKADA